MNFVAEIIRTSQRKLVSGDNQYEVVFRTENPMVLDLGKLPSDCMFRVDIGLIKSDDNIKGSLKDKEDVKDAGVVV